MTRYSLLTIRYSLLVAHHRAYDDGDGYAAGVGLAGGGGIGYGSVVTPTWGDGRGYGSLVPSGVATGCATVAVGVGVTSAGCTTVAAGAVGVTMMMAGVRVGVGVGALDVQPPDASTSIPSVSSTPGSNALSAQVLSAE
jgi:hypothetical protein